MAASWPLSSVPRGGGGGVRSEKHKPVANQDNINVGGNLGQENMSGKYNKKVEERGKTNNGFHIRTVLAST